MGKAAIPTRYSATQFRSRLEARWACFFDLIGWKWEYEPFDLEGYIPDFLVLGTHPLLVEVKPYARLAEMEPLAANLPPAPYDYLIVGATPFLGECCSGIVAGLVSQGADWWGEAIWSSCCECGAVYLVHLQAGWVPHGPAKPCDSCRKPGLCAGDGAERLLADGWAEARNLTQWMAA